MKKVLLLLTAVLLSLGLASGSTSGYLVDTEVASSSIDAAEFNGVTLLEDGFESDPWEAKWNDNGITTWALNNDSYSGQRAALCDKGNNGYLTSDDVDTSAATTVIVSFWFKPKSLEAGDILIQLYDGSTYNTLYDLADYPAYEDNTWCYFRQETTDSQYFNSNFRLRFDGSGLVDNSEKCRIDNVLIEMQTEE